MNSYTITNHNNLRVSTHPLGARLVNIYTPDRNGVFADIIQGFDSEPEYITKGKSQGAICGRFANRISNASFQLNGSEYQLPKNNGEHCLHGGNEGLRTAIWQIKNRSTSEITYTYFSPHLDCGFPGNVQFEVTYKLTRSNELKIHLKATTDRETPINLTAHPYFNLQAQSGITAFSHQVKIVADQFLEINKEMIPTGKKLSVHNSDFDFRDFNSIEHRIESKHPQIQLVNGFDHCYVFANEQPETVQINAILMEQNTGRVVKVFSDYPGIQFYTANDLQVRGKNGKLYNPYSAICLEPQYLPDSPNQTTFPNTVFSPEKPYQHVIIYKFEQLHYG